MVATRHAPLKPNMLKWCNTNHSIRNTLSSRVTRRTRMASSYRAPCHRRSPSHMGTTKHQRLRSSTRKFHELLSVAAQRCSPDQCHALMETHLSLTRCSKAAGQVA